MNTLTSRFWENDFPGQNIVSLDFQDFWSQKIPMVRLPWIKISLENLLQQCHSLWDQFETVESQRETDWWSRPHSQGWSVLSIRSPSGHITKDYLGYKNKIQNPWPNRESQFRFFLDEMGQQGLTVKYANIWKLSPKGWLAPHRDPRTHGLTMNYFYMPINQSATMRIWPLGEITLSPGEMILFNQNDFVHSVINSTPDDRLVIAGRIDIHQVPEYTMDLIKTATCSQYEQ